MSDELPEGWVETKLAKLAERITKGATPTSYGFKFQKEGITFVKIENIRGGKIDYASLRDRISLEAHRAQARSILQTGDLLFSIAGTIGTTCLVTAEDLPANTNQALAIIRGSSSTCDPDYLLHVLSDRVARRALEETARGGAMNNVSLADVGDFDIPVAPLPEQRRIVEAVEALLQQVNRAKERLDRLPLILKRFRQAVLAAACSGELTREWRTRRLSPPVAPSLAMLLERRRSLWEGRNGSTKKTRRYPEPFQPAVPDGFDLPDDWTWVTASHLALLDVGFAFKSAEFTDHGVRLLRGENVEPSSLRWAETRCWPEDRLDEVRHLLVEPGEIILALDRPIVSAGLKIARVKPSDIPALLVQRVMRFKMVQPTDTDYLYLCLSQQRFIDFVAHEGMTGSDLPHITGTGVAEFPIPLPLPDEQREIVRRADALFALADAIERQLLAATTSTEKLPQAILSKAFSGELVPTEADLARAEGRTYETAEELLARVRRETENGAPPRVRSRRAV